MIDARRLRVLREVAQQGTLAAAADALHLTPSAVSQQLAALEREVGQPVIERNGRGVRLTGAAEVLVGHANVVLAQLEAAAADVAAYAEGVVGTVRIVGFATALARSSRRRGRAARDPPAADATIIEQEAPGAASALARGDVDIAISMASRLARRDPASRSAAADRHARRRPARPATGSPRGEIALAELAGEPFVGPPEGTSCHDVTVTGCAPPASRRRSSTGRSTSTPRWRSPRRASASRSSRGSESAVPPGAIGPVRAPAPARHVFAATRAGAERRPTVAAVLESASRWRTGCRGPPVIALGGRPALGGRGAARPDAGLEGGARRHSAIQPRLPGRARRRSRADLVRVPPVDQSRPATAPNARGVIANPLGRDRRRGGRARHAMATKRPNPRLWAARVEILAIDGARVAPIAPTPLERDAPRSSYVKPVL